MGVTDPRAWVKKLERLYRAYDAEGVSNMYMPDATTRFGSSVIPPELVHRHPYEWFGSLEDYEIARTFRAAHGDIIVSETRATYRKKSVDPEAMGDERYKAGQRYREFGVDIYWVNDEGRIYHKHTLEIVEPHKEEDDLGEPLHE
jgi:hypothetical protein